MKVVSNRKNPLVRSFTSNAVFDLNSEQLKIYLSQENLKPVKLHEEASLKQKKKLPKKTKKKPGCFSSVEKWDYKHCQKLHFLWKGYMTNLLKDSFKETKINRNILQEILLKVDFHGAILRVVQSKCISFKNKEGIVVTESKNLFQLVTNLNKVIKIPKKNSVFEVKFKTYKITIFGDQFCIKPGVRLTKKFNKYIYTLPLV